MAAAQDGVDGIGRILPGGALRPVGGAQDSGSSAQRRRPPGAQAPPQEPGQEPAQDKDDERGVPPGPDTTRGRHIDEMA